MSSDPAGAAVFVDGEFRGVTPTIVTLKRRGRAEILRFEKNGFRTIDVPVKRSLSPLIAGNAGLSGVGLFAGAANPDPGSDAESKARAAALLFPAIGVGVDLLTGAGYKLPSRVHVTLEPTDAAPKLHVDPVVLLFQQPARIPRAAALPGR